MLQGVFDATCSAMSPLRIDRVESEPMAHFLTRRDLLAKATAASVACSGGVIYAKASQPATPVNFDVPPGACDCHTHIVGDPAKFPLSPTRVYTSEPASPEEMSRLHRALHIQRVVIVTPS